MKRRIQLAVGIALALTVFGALTATALAAPPVTDAHQLRPGLGDFGLAGGAIVVAPPVTDARPDKPGLRDFGIPGSTAALNAVSPSTPAPTTTAAVDTTRGFDWADAGIGAAATLGLVLVLGGLGAALVHRGQQRRELRGA
jgi:hypothetical protein